MRQLLIKFAVVVLFIVSFLFAAHGQDSPGANDPSFNITDVNLGAGTGFNAVVNTIVLQPDGKMLVGGEFTSYNGININRIARLNTDGVLDASFNIGTGISGNSAVVKSIVLQPDGKIIVGGGFQFFNGISRGGIARLNSDGTLDDSFNPVSGVLGAIYAMALQVDGKIIVGGNFTYIAGSGRNRIARLNTDGTLDTSFDPGSGFNGDVLALTLQPDGKVIAGGLFSSFNSISHTNNCNNIARLNNDGSLDNSFNQGSGFNALVRCIALQPDGKIIVGGLFSSFNGSGRGRIARLNVDGTLDTSFSPGFGFDNQVLSIILQQDGKIMAGGTFTTFNGSTRLGIARLNANGTNDGTFTPETGFIDYVYAIALLPDARLIVTGQLRFVNRFGIFRLNTDGSLDASFNAGTGFNSDVFSIALQPDGKMLVGGSFNSINGINRNRIARLNADGTIDTSFDPGTGFNNTINSIIIQPDNKIVVGGAFTSFNGIARNRIARLNADGTLDTSFNPGTGFNNTVYAVNLLPDGKLLMGGAFTTFNGSMRSGIARLQSDGSLDFFFNPQGVLGAGFNNTVYTISLQTDNKILVGGGFSTFNGTAHNMIARFNADGSLDSSFNPGTGFSGTNGYVLSLVLQPDGRILAGGNFASFNGTTRNNIARLNADGSLDASFNPGTGFTRTGSIGTVFSINLQPDERIMVGGEFTSFNGADRNNIARLNADGALDVSFNQGTGFDAVIRFIARQPDGKILAGGNFSSYNDIPRRRIARLFGGSGTLSTAKKLQEELNVLVYPNPSKGDINLLLSDEAVSGVVQVTLYNATGQHVFTKSVTAAEVKSGIKLPTAELSKGVYFISIRISGTHIIKKLILE